MPEPKNKHDPCAIAVLSARDVQIGYLNAERCGWVGSRIRLGEDVRAIFREAAKGGALVRLSVSGEDPLLPKPRSKRERCPPPETDEDFYPDDIPPDDW